MTVSFVEQGQGTPLVLLHGIGSAARSFDRVIAAFAPRFRVVAWDAPGYVDSTDLPMEQPTAGDYADALAAFLDEMGIRTCHLLGHSLGCLMAARFARQSPEKVAALVLISPALGYGVEKGAPLPTGAARRIEELDRLGSEKFAAARAPGLVADPAARPDVVRAVEQAMAAVRRPGYDQAVRLLAGGRILDDAAKLTMPAAVLVGAQDRITPPASCRRAFDAMPGGAPRHVYQEILDAGHAVCQEQPAVVARAISEIVENKANVHA